MAEPPGEELCVEVCHIGPDLQFLQTVHLPAGATIEQAIRQSGVLQVLPNIDLAQVRVGIHGKLRTLDSLLQAHDRVEIYRPLQIDPMDARRRRVEARRKLA